MRALKKHGEWASDEPLVRERFKLYLLNNDDVRFVPHKRDWVVNHLHGIYATGARKP